YPLHAPSLHDALPISSYVTMPNMDQTFEVTEPGTLLVVVVAPATGLLVWAYAVGEWAYVYPQTRLLINDQVVEEDPLPPNDAGLDTMIWAGTPGSFYVKLEFGSQDTYPKAVNAKLQWRVARHYVNPDYGVIRATR